MCCIGFSLLVSAPHTLGELLDPSDRVVTSFGGLALQAFPGMANQVVAFTVLVRYVLVGLIGAACYTRFDPMRKSYDLVACSMIFCVIISEAAPPMLIVLRDANPHPELWTNTTLEAFPSSAKIATEEMAASSCFAILLAVSGISPLAYLVRLSRAYRTRPPHAPAKLRFSFRICRVAANFVRISSSERTASADTANAKRSRDSSECQNPRGRSPRTRACANSKRGYGTP